MERAGPGAEVTCPTGRTRPEEEPGMLLTAQRLMAVLHRLDADLSADVFTDSRYDFSRDPAGLLHLSCRLQVHEPVSATLAETGSGLCPRCCTANSVGLEDLAPFAEIVDFADRSDIPSDVIAVVDLLRRTVPMFTWLRTDDAAQAGAGAVADARNMLSRRYEQLKAELRTPARQQQVTDLIRTRTGQPADDRSSLVGIRRYVPALNPDPVTDAVVAAFWVRHFPISRFVLAMPADVAAYLTGSPYLLGANTLLSRPEPADRDGELLGVAAGLWEADEAAGDLADFNAATAAARDVIGSGSHTRTA
jgi:hypothetical protein